METLSLGNELTLPSEMLSYALKLINDLINESLTGIYS